MSRNMIQLNKNIFDRIKSLVTEFGGHTEFQEKICINTSLEEKDWIQHATFKNDGGYNEMTKVSCQNGLSFGEIYYKDSRYIVINDDFDYELDKASFQFQEPNSGIFTILLSQEFINANEDSLSELYELHLFSDGTNALRKLSFDDIDSCFSGFCLIKVDSEVFISANLNTIVCHLLNEKAKQDCKKKKLYDEHLYLPLNDLILNGHETIPFDIIVHGIGNFDHPKTLYLDLYRSLERLYVSSYMSNLKKVLDIQISHEDLSEKIENVTGWRPKEEPALIELLSLLDEYKIDESFRLLSQTSIEIDKTEVEYEERHLKSIRLNLDSINDLKRRYSEEINLDKMKEKLLERKIKIIGSRVYKVRNSLVHYRSIFDGYLKNDDDIFILNGLLCSIVKNVYSVVER